MRDINENTVMDSILDSYISIGVIDLTNGIVDIITPGDTDNEVSISIVDYANDVTDKAIGTDKEMVTAVLDPERLMQRLAYGFKTEMVIKAYNGNSYSSFRFETVRLDDTRALLLWKEADNVFGLFEDSIKLLTKVYHKVIKINLTKDLYKEIMSDGTTKNTLKLSAVFKDFANNGNVFAEDMNEFYKFTDIENLSSLFDNGKFSKKDFRYRRLSYDGTFRWTIMEVIPSKEYTLDNKVIMVYIRDIHDDYTHQLVEQRRMYYSMTRDPLTKINNKLAYSNKTADLLDTNNLGVVYISILPNISDKSERNNLIKKIASFMVENMGEINCYRMDYLEFVVLSENVKNQEFVNKVNNLINDIKSAKLDEKCSIEYLWNEDSALTIGNIVEILEEKIYER